MFCHFIPEKVFSVTVRLAQHIAKSLQKHMETQCLAGLQTHANLINSFQHASQACVYVCVCLRWFSTPKPAQGFLPRLQTVPAYWSVVFPCTTPHTHTPYTHVQTHREREREGGSSESSHDINQNSGSPAALQCIIKLKVPPELNYNNTL